MRTELFDYSLPEELIAPYPLPERDGARLCVLGPEEPSEARVRDLPRLVEPGDLLVLNETKVRPARVFCERPRSGSQGGGRVEVVFLRQLEAGQWEALARANRPLRPGDKLAIVEAGLELTVEKKGEQGTIFLRSTEDVEEALARHGQMPLPPYMRRAAEDLDRSRYQTVFAKEVGSAAAPTAGLHLTPELLSEIEAKGGRVARLVLHVGLGTFRPVSTDDLDDHAMHEEWIRVTAEVSEAVRRTREQGGRVVAIGTTVVRALESLADEQGQIAPGERATRLLIQPGYRFRVVDALLTNFHMPKSTLVALVSALGGRERVLAAYEWAIARKFRFLSYGDAMWIPGRMAE